MSRCIELRTHGQSIGSCIFKISVVLSTISNMWNHKSRVTFRSFKDYSRSIRSNQERVTSYSNSYSIIIRIEAPTSCATINSAICNYIWRNTIKRRIIKIIKFTICHRKPSIYVIISIYISKCKTSAIK